MGVLEYLYVFSCSVQACMIRVSGTVTQKSPLCVYKPKIYGAEYIKCCNYVNTLTPLCIPSVSKISMWWTTDDRPSIPFKNLLGHPWRSLLTFKLSIYTQIGIFSDKIPFSGEIYRKTIRSIILIDSYFMVSGPVNTK